MKFIDSGAAHRHIGVLCVLGVFCVLGVIVCIVINCVVMYAVMYTVVNLYHETMTMTMTTMTKKEAERERERGTYDAHNTQKHCQQR